MLNYWRHDTTQRKQKQMLLKFAFTTLPTVRKFLLEKGLPRKKQNGPPSECAFLCVLRAPRHTNYSYELQKLYNPCRRPQQTAKYIPITTTKTINTKNTKKTKKKNSKTPAKLMAHEENSGKLFFLFFGFFGFFLCSLFFWVCF